MRSETGWIRFCSIRRQYLEDALHSEPGQSHKHNIFKIDKPKVEESSESKEKSQRVLPSEIFSFDHVGSKEDAWDFPTDHIGEVTNSVCLSLEDEGHNEKLSKEHEVDQKPVQTQQHSFPDCAVVEYLLVAAMALNQVLVTCCPLVDLADLVKCNIRAETFFRKLGQDLDGFLSMTFDQQNPDRLRHLPGSQDQQNRHTQNCEFLRIPPVLHFVHVGEQNGQELTSNRYKAQEKQCAASILFGELF